MNDVNAQRNQMNIGANGNGGDDKWSWNWPLMISLSGFALYRKHCLTKNEKMIQISNK